MRLIREATARDARSSSSAVRKPGYQCRSVASGRGADRAGHTRAAGNRRSPALLADALFEKTGAFHGRQHSQTSGTRIGGLAGRHYFRPKSGGLPIAGRAAA